MPLIGRTLKSRLSAAVLLVGGVALCLTGIWITVANVDFLRHSKRAPGVVVEIVGERGAKGTKLYHPVVRYHPPAEGANVMFKAEPGMWPSLFDVGDGVTVAYREDDPEDAKIVSFWMLWFLPATIISFGVGCLIGGRHTLVKSV